MGDLRKALEMQLQLPMGQVGLSSARFCFNASLESLKASLKGSAVENRHADSLMTRESRSQTIAV